MRWLVPAHKITTKRHETDTKGIVISRLKLQTINMNIMVANGKRSQIKRWNETGASKCMVIGGEYIKKNKERAHDTVSVLEFKSYHSFSIKHKCSINFSVKVKKAARFVHAEKWFEFSLCLIVENQLSFVPFSNEETVNLFFQREVQKNDSNQCQSSTKIRTVFEANKKNV